MHQIVINVIRSDAGELLAEGALDLCMCLHKVVRKLCCDIDFVPETVVPGKNLPEGRFNAGIDIRHVVIIHAKSKGTLYLGLRFVDVDLPGRILCKTHTAKTELGDRIPISVFSVDHAFVDRVFVDHAFADHAFVDRVFADHAVSFLSFYREIPGRIQSERIAGEYDHKRSRR